MAETLARRVAQLPAHSGLVVAFSGGPDSTALLHALAQFPGARARGLRAIHVHHGLSPQADAWAASCAAVAARLGVPLRILHVTVPAASPLGVEGAAREQRYAALRTDLATGEVLLTAHHADDQAETVLSRLARSAGAQGLQGIHAVMEFPPGHLCRPLLDTTRAELAGYLAQQGLGAIDDPMNADPDRERTFLRHSVLPMLEARWPGFARSAARSARLLAEAADAEACRIRRDLAAVALPAPGTLDIDQALALPDQRLVPLLRAFVAEAGFGQVPSRMIDEAIRQLRAGSTTLHLAHGPWAVRQYRRTLHVLREPVLLPWPETWNGEAALPTHAGRVLVSDRIFPRALAVRSRIGGERIRLNAGGPRQELRDLFQRHGIPSWQRDVPLLFHDDTLVAVGDWFLADCWETLSGGARLRALGVPDSLSA